MTDPPTVDHRPRPYRLRQVVRAELIKLRSLRSTTWTLLATVVGSLLVTVLATPASTHRARRSGASIRPTSP